MLTRLRCGCAPEGSDTKDGGLGGDRKEGIPLTSRFISICDLIRGGAISPGVGGGEHWPGGWYLKGKADSAAE